MKMKFTRPDLLVGRGSTLTDLKTHKTERIVAGPWYDDHEKPKHNQIIEVMKYDEFKETYPTIESEPKRYIDCYAINRRNLVVIVF